MITALLCLCAMSVHYIYGQSPGDYRVTIDGDPLAIVTAYADGMMRVETDRHGLVAVTPDTLIVPACADLLVIPSGNLPIACGAVTRLRVRVQNLGTEPAAPTATSISLDGVLAGQVSTPAVAPGAEVWTDWLTISRPPGRYIISGCADVGNQVAESDETNNCSQQ